MKKVYVIHKQGEMYGHGVHGIFTSRIDAENMADKIAEKDKDNYHYWDVYQIPMNTVCGAEERGNEGFTSSMGKNKRVYRTNKGNQ